MIVFPCAKINLGLNVVSKRQDGYHNLETVFYPLPIYDTLEANEMDDRFPSETGCDLKVTGNCIDCDERSNLVVKAYNMLSEHYRLKRLHIHLHKEIPSQAGLGGGSSDAAYMIRLLNMQTGLGMTDKEMETYAARLGADCAFFITSSPAYATGIGDKLSPIESLGDKLKGYFIAVVKPDIAISTKEAYSAIQPKSPAECCLETVTKRPIEEWKGRLTNDFESSLFTTYPRLKEIKEKLYELGAVYAQMSGSGSSVFGIFKNRPNDLDSRFPEDYTSVCNV